ncbi:hypothetical protein N182_34090 [Sinorhizobium sp. GL2]|nr:hypothetical protein N182_34090 [Sinorhizobium sp. GL2]
MPHPGPWRAAKGGFSFDITIELHISEGEKPGGFSNTDTASWLMALLRLGHAPYLTAPVTIDMPFSQAAHSEITPIIAPLEVQDRHFFRSDERSEELSIVELEWLKDAWELSADLARTNPQFQTAVLACDSCRVRSAPLNRC